MQGQRSASQVTRWLRSGGRPVDRRRVRTGPPTRSVRRAAAAGSVAVPLLRNRLANPVVRALARTPAHRLLGKHLVLLRYTGRRSGRCYELPVMSAPAGADLVVVSGQHSAKTWWRNFTAAPQPVMVRRNGRLERRTARRLSPADAGYAEAVRAYRRQFPHVQIDVDTPVLVLARSREVPAPG